LRKYSGNWHSILSACIRSLEVPDGDFKLYLGEDLQNAVYDLWKLLQNPSSKDEEIIQHINSASLALITQEAPNFHIDPTRDIMRQFLISFTQEHGGSFMDPKLISPTCAGLQFCMRLIMLTKMVQDMDVGKKTFDQ